MSKTYRTKDGTKVGTVPGVGEIVDGQITVSDDVVINNVNFELVKEETQPTAQSAPAAPAASTVPPTQATTAPVQPPVPQTPNQEVK